MPPATLAERLNSLVTRGDGATRAPVALPGGVGAGTRSGQPSTCSRVPGARTRAVDGYNVAKLGWPDEAARRRSGRAWLDIVDDVVRRYSTDGDRGLRRGRRRRQPHPSAATSPHIRYSPAGVSADDEIRVEVAGTPVDRAVVVVTNDQAIRRDVAAAGANLISSESFLAIAR